MADAAQHSAADSTAEKLPLDEIWRRYPDEWVVLVDTDRTNTRTTHGVVYAHSRSRREAAAMSRGLRDWAIFWTGEIQSPTLWFMTHARRDV